MSACKHGHANGRASCYRCQDEAIAAGFASSREQDAFARGYAKAVEDAAREAETHGEACGHGFDGDAGRCIAEDIRALTPEPKKDGGT